MSGSISAVAERGALRFMNEARQLVERSIAERGPRAPIALTNSVYYLPVALGSLAKPVEKLVDLQEVLERASTMTDGDLAMLLAAESIEALRAPAGRVQNPVSDQQVRSWGIQLADGRMPGIALIIGSAKNGAAAADLIEALRRDNFLCLLSGPLHGTSIVDQLRHEGVELGEGEPVVPLGADPASAVHAFGFVARCAMKLGGFKPGAWNEIVEFARRRLPGFVLVLGDPDEEARAIAEAADCFEFPVIYEGQTAKATEDAQHLIQRGMLARGILPRVFAIDIPVPYGAAFDEQVIDYGDLHVQFGGGDRVAFQFLQVAGLSEITDGKIELIGPDPSNGNQAAHLDLGLIVKVAGPRLMTDYEPYLEKQIGSFINYASGVRHTGSQEAISIRISQEAAAKGFSLESLGKILHRRFRQEFGEAVQKVQIALITDSRQHAEWFKTARAAYEARAQRLASLTDNDVDEFYTCSRCRTFSPSDICLISPERISACGGCNWLEAKATYELHPGGLRHPIKLGKQLDARRGTWEGTNAYALAASQGRVEEVSLYSIMDHPLGACGAFECLVMLIPEANGVMVVAQDETSKTPAGLDVASLANVTGGIPMPGVMGIGKRYLLSPRFMSADGGFSRVVWMSSSLKAALGSELRAVCARAGQPDLLAKIADERHVTTVEQLLPWLKQHDHPALTMKKMF